MTTAHRTKYSSKVIGRKSGGKGAKMYKKIDRQKSSQKVRGNTVEGKLTMLEMFVSLISLSHVYFRLRKGRIYVRASRFSGRFSEFCIQYDRYIPETGL